MITDKCRCGEEGYEGVFCRVDWTCQKCGRKNTWKESDAIVGHTDDSSDKCAKRHDKTAVK